MHTNNAVHAANKADENAAVRILCTASSIHLCQIAVKDSLYLHGQADIGICTACQQADAFFLWKQDSFSSEIGISSCMSVPRLLWYPFCIHTYDKVQAAEIPALTIFLL